MEARGFGVTWVRTFVLFDAMVLLPFSLFFWIAFESWRAAAIAFGCGSLITATLSLLAADIIRAYRVSVGFPDRELFLQAVNELLPSVGYRQLSGEADLLISKPAGIGILAPRISLAIDGASAIFTGPRERVRRLIRYMEELEGTG